MYMNIKKYKKEKANFQDIKAYNNSSHWIYWVDAFHFLRLEIDEIFIKKLNNNVWRNY